MTINYSNIKGVSAQPFVGPIFIKGGPAKITKIDYERAMQLDYDNNGVVDYESINDDNPFLNIDRYISNNYTDEQIIIEINKYRKEHPNDTYFNGDTSDILLQIKLTMLEKMSFDEAIKFFSPEAMMNKKNYYLKLAKKYGVPKTVEEYFNLSSGQSPPLDRFGEYKNYIENHPLQKALDADYDFYVNYIVTSPEFKKRYPASYYEFYSYGKLKSSYVWEGKQNILRLLSEDINNTSPAYNKRAEDLTVRTPKNLDKPDFTSLYPDRPDFIIPGAIYWYDSSKMSSYRLPKVRINLNNYPEISDSDIEYARRLQAVVVERRRIDLAFERECAYFVSLIAHRENTRVRGVNDFVGGMADFDEHVLTIRYSDGTVKNFYFDEYEEEIAYNCVREEWMYRRNLMLQDEMELLEYTTSKIVETQAFKDFVENELDLSNFNITRMCYLENIVYSDYMTDQEKALYCFIKKHDGEETAESYLEQLKDTLNQRIGIMRAAATLKKYRKPDGSIDESIFSHLGIAAEGFDDGLQKFFENIMDIFSSEEAYSPHYYEMIAIATALSSESSTMGKAYELGAAFGENAVGYALALTVLVATEGTGKDLAVAIMKLTSALSKAGSSKHKALHEGYGKSIATFYAIGAAGMSYAVDTIFDAIPGLDKLGATFWGAAFRTGSKKIFQALLEKSWDSLLLGKPINWQELGVDSIFTFIDGFISGAVTFGIKQIHFADGKVYTLTGDEISKMKVWLEENESGTVTQAIYIFCPELYKKIYGSCTSEVKKALEDLMLGLKTIGG